MKFINIDPKETKDMEEDYSIDNVDNFLKDLEIDFTPFPYKTLGLMFKYGSQLRKDFSHKDTVKILRFINNEFVEDKLPNNKFYSLSDSLKDHIKIDIKPISDKALEYLRMVESATFRDIKDYCKESSELVTKALDVLIKEDFVIKHRKEYKLINKIVWKDRIEDLGELLDFKVPYFDDKQYWRWGDIILIGARTGTGKTAICMNMIKDLVNQGIKPYYIPTEIGGRHGIVARTLGLKDGDYLYPTNPCLHAENIQLEAGVSFIDWLLPKDYSEVDKLFQMLSQKMARIRGFLIIFMQLKDFENGWYAPSMCKMFPSFATRYLLNEDRKGGVFKIDKIREAKGLYSYEELPCTYDFETKALLPVDLADKDYQNIIKEFNGNKI